MGFVAARGRFLPTLVLFGCTLLSGSSAHAGENDDSEPQAQVTEAACSFGSSRPGKLRSEQEPTACGRYCATTTHLTVEGSDGALLLALTNDESSGPALSEEDGGRPLLRVSCQRGAVVITLEEADDVALSLRWDARRRRLRLVQGAALQRALTPTALSGRGAAQREQVRLLARALLEGVEASERSGGEPARVGGVEPALVDRLALLTAQDAIESGAWERGQKALDAVSGAWGVDGATAAYPPSALRSQVARLRDELAARRRKSQPVHVLQRSRLGTVKNVQSLPIDPGVAPTLFWRHDELCVVQEDASGTMRCYAPATQRWGARAPVDLPASSGRELKQLEFGSSVESCTGRSSLVLVVRKDIPDRSVNPCEQGPGSDLEEVLAVVDRNALLRVGFQIDRGGSRGESLDAVAANSAFARSAGGLLAGNGSSRFLRDGRLALISDDGERRWDILGRAPGEAWVAPPLVSPDQRWVVVQSKRAEQLSLWLFRLSPAAP